MLQFTILQDDIDFSLLFALSIGIYPASKKPPKTVFFLAAGFLAAVQMIARFTNNCAAVSNDGVSSLPPFHRLISTSAQAQRLAVLNDLEEKKKKEMKKV